MAITCSGRLKLGCVRQPTSLPCGVEPPVVVIGVTVVDIEIAEMGDDGPEAM